MDKTQVRYEELEQLASRLDTLATQTEARNSVIKSRLVELAAGGWHGSAAARFQDEMENIVLPAHLRLKNVLDAASHLLKTVSEQFKDAELKANALFQAPSGGLVSASVVMVTAPGGAAGSVLTGPDSSGKFKIGPPQRPNIEFDGGFTEFCAANAAHDDCSPDVRIEDIKNRAKYEVLLSGAQALGHLDNGTDAYAHYLSGEGKDWAFDYGEFVKEDANGKKAFENILRDAQHNAEIIGQGRDHFSITSEGYGIGGKDPRFPYPSSENWQKAIGGHQVWTSADVTVTTDASGRRVYSMTVTFNGEDRYNFNPGAEDIASGALDRENGRFEVLKWAHPFMSYGSTTTALTWTEGDISTPEYSEPTSGRSIDHRTPDQRPDIPDR